MMKGLKILSVVFLAISIFILDYYTELGIASGVPYVLLALLALWFRNNTAPVWLAGLSTFLIIAGMYFSPSGGEPYKIIINRAYTIMAVWAVSVALYVHLRGKLNLEIQKDKFRKQSLELRQQLDTLNAAAIVSITDRKGDIIFANDLFCKISGYKKDELIGENHRILKSGEQPDGLFKDMWSAITKGKIWQGELCNKARDGNLYWVATTITPFFDKQGDIEKFVSVRFDITPQKRQAIELKEQSEKIRKRCRQLAISNKKLEATNEDLESFSYIVSHDLKAPLRALQGFSRNLYKKYGDAFDETGRRWLKYIRINAERMDTLISDILAFSRMGRQNMKKEKVDMEQMVREICETTGKSYPDKKVNLSVEKLPVAKADRSAIALLWYNLIDNAFKYSSQNETIDIQIKGYEDEKNTFYSISDNGVGFDMKYYDKLFGIFQRLHSDDQFEGTGIGLANVKQVIGKHEGEIEAESEPGKGTTIKFQMPKS